MIDREGGWMDRRKKRKKRRGQEESEKTTKRGYNGEETRGYSYENDMRVDKDEKVVIAMILS